MAGASTGTTSAQAFDPALLARVRDRFCHVDADPIQGERIYFENAGGALTLKRVTETSARIDALPDNAGRANATSKHLGEIIADGRRAVATFLNAKDGVIATREGATAMIFALVDAATTGVTTGNVICTNIDHPATYDGAEYYCRLRNLERRVAGVDTASGTVPQQAILDRVDADTVAVAMVHASNVTGGLNDITGLADAVRAIAPAAQIIIDGTQYVQHGGVDVDALDVDGYIFAAYKVFSKVGAGFAYVSPRLATARHPRLAGKSETEWDLGTRDAGNYACFREVVSYLEWLGAAVDPECGSDSRTRLEAAMRGIVAHETALSERLLAGLAKMPIARVLGDPMAGPDRQAVFAIALDGVDPGDIVARLAQRRIVIHDRVRDAFSAHVLEALAAESALRVSLAHYNTLDEVDRFLAVLDETVGEA
jgi:cysteine desulfurase/selenocysteine lyase